jgi:hypothetical protein
VGCLAAFVVAWRLWNLRSWACIVTIAAAWLFCLLEPWRPAHYPGEVVDPAGAIGASLMACAIVAVPLTLAWITGRSQLRAGF